MTERRGKRPNHFDKLLLVVEAGVEIRELAVAHDAEPANDQITPGYLTRIARPAHPAMALRGEHGLGARGHAELRIKVIEVEVDRARAHAERGGDRFITQPLGQPPEHLQLARRHLGRWRDGNSGNQLQAAMRAYAGRNAAPELLDPPPRAEQCVEAKIGIAIIGERND